MASEPERPIEKLLREAARKRRDEAPASFEPHPATRRLLQGEVARQYPQAGRDTGRRLSWSWRVSPRLSWAVASLAVLAIGVWVFSPKTSHKEQEQLFARNEPADAPAQPSKKAPSAENERRVQPTPASEESPSSANFAQSDSSTTSAPGLASTVVAQARQPAVRSDSLAMSNPGAPGTSMLDAAKTASLPLAKSEQKVASETQTDLSGALADKSLPPAQSAGVIQSKDQVATANVVSGFASANQPMPATPAAAARLSPTAPTPHSAAPTPPAESGTSSILALQTATNSFELHVPLAQHFVRSAPRSKTFGGQNAQTPEQRLLVSFQIEQNGPEIRVKDEDGSVYFGYVQPAEAASVLREGVKAVPATSGRSASLKLTDAAVTAHGSSSPAPQTFFFRVAGTNQTLRQPVLFTGSISNAPGYGLSPTQLSGARISGRVRVGTQREFEMLATPRNP